jgi:hypothetical protein
MGLVANNLQNESNFANLQLVNAERWAEQKSI